MIVSMTGYGRSELNFNGITVKTEIRSLNSRFFDFSSRLPSSIKEKEMEIRNVVSEQLGRGKVDLLISIDDGSDTKPAAINRAMAKKYFDELKSLSKEFGTGKKNLLELVLRMPEVMSTEKNEGSEEDWKHANESLQAALNELILFRQREGKELEQILKGNIAGIINQLLEIEKVEMERTENIRNRITTSMQEIRKSAEVDTNRFEQELIYYIERMDFSEEKMRLKSHCDFFLKTLDEKDSNGRRLNFISQEIGREVNTLGSKANHAGIQKLVVQMKDELEKIKEQLLNVL